MFVVTSALSEASRKMDVDVWIRFSNKLRFRVYIDFYFNFLPFQNSDNVEVKIQIVKEAWNTAILVVHAWTQKAALGNL